MLWFGMVEPSYQSRQAGWPAVEPRSTEPLQGVLVPWYLRSERATSNVPTGPQQRRKTNLPNDSNVPGSSDRLGG